MSEVPALFTDLVCLFMSSLYLKYTQCIIESLRNCRASNMFFVRSQWAQPRIHCLQPLSDFAKLVLLDLSQVVCYI